MTKYKQMNSFFIVVMSEKIANGVLTVLQNAAVTITIYFVRITWFSDYVLGTRKYMYTI